MPTVSWWRGSVMLDNSTFSTSKGVSNVLTSKFTRNELMAALTCQASNTNLSTPVRRTINIDLNCKTNISLSNEFSLLVAHCMHHSFHWSLHTRRKTAYLTVLLLGFLLATFSWLLVFSHGCLLLGLWYSKTNRSANNYPVTSHVCRQASRACMSDEKLKASSENHMEKRQYIARKWYSRNTFRRWFYHNGIPIDSAFAGWWSENTYLHSWQSTYTWLFNHRPFCNECLT